MRTSIERLRVWLVAGAALLLLVIAGFLGYAHFRAHRFLKDLPGRLGVDLRQEANGFTYSQSLKGRTVFTMHAAKALQRKDGKTTLRDVGIVLYGQQGDRADRIYGDEFEYDQAAGVVRAQGVVHLDLQAPTPGTANGKAQYAAGKEVMGQGGSERHGEEADNDQLVHVKTSGLVFLQKLGVASTDQEIEFRYQGLNGRAKGADFNSDTGVTVLQSEVRVSGLREGRPVVLTASRAEMDRGKQMLTLDRARYVALPRRARDEGETATAERAMLHLRNDGSIEHATGAGGVTMVQGGGTLKAARADVSIGEGNKVQAMHLAGGLTYASDEATEKGSGSAAEGTAKFDGAGRLTEAVLHGGVEMVQRMLVTGAGAEGAGAWTERRLSGADADALFAVAGGRSMLREVRASGGARMLLTEPGRKADDAAAMTTSELRGDVLTAEFEADGTTSRVRRVMGNGKTSLRRRDAVGAEQTSRGDELEATFSGAAAARGDARAKGRGGRSGLERVVQRGNVEVTDTAAARKAQSGAAPLTTTAKGAEGVYEAAAQMLMLNGGVQVAQGDGVVLADRVRMMQASGDASATGAVKATYRQTGSAEPVHVLAGRAEMHRDTSSATFFGAPGKDARMWQGGSQVEAPVIEMRQKERLLLAHGEAAGGAGAGVVRTVLTGGVAPVREGEERNGAKLRAGRTVRISSGTLRYSDAERMAEFGGGVLMNDAEGLVRSRSAVAYLRAVSAANGTAIGGLGGGVERVVAKGDVALEQTGRRGNGEQLEYTAADGMFVLTGTAAAPPTVVDEAQGRVSGAALRFHAGDNSVTVDGDSRPGETRRVRTETRVRQQ